MITVLINAIRFLINVYRALSRRPPDYIWLTVSGSLPEFRVREGFPRRVVSASQSGLALEDLREVFDRLSDRREVQGVVLRIQDLNADWAALEEARSEVALFRASGKRVVAYMVGADTRAYYLACAADRVYATPASTLSVTGLSSRVNFLRDALERVGVEGEVLAVSPYKSAGETFTRNDFSAEAREQAERLLDRRYEQLESGIAEGRGMSAEMVREKIDNAPYGASRAVEEGLLDGIAYEDELSGKLGGVEGVQVREWSRARLALKLPYRSLSRRRIGVVGATGTITRGASRRVPVPLPLVGGEQAGSDSVVAALRLAEQDRRIGSVLFHVDSRGGDSLASDLIWREVERIDKRSKPVVVLMGNTAASGGYYISAAARSIVARRSTVTGSIGVILLRPNFAGLYGKLGINPVTLERGANSGLFDTSHALRPADLDKLGEQLQEIYAQFKDRVHRGRGLSEEEIEPLAGGRVWTGAEARELGLVDDLGGYRAALRRAAAAAGMPPEEAARSLVHLRPPRRGRPEPGSPQPAGLLSELTGLPETLRAARRLQKSGTWLVAPYRFDPYEE